MSTVWIGSFVLLPLLGFPVGETGPVTLPARLPKELTLQEEGPQRYIFRCEYLQTDERDRFIGKHRLTARYTRGRPDGKVVWSDVHLARSKEMEGEYGEGEPQEFMEGFSYDPSLKAAMFLPFFFRNFPATPTSSYAKNLVWDTHMIEDFGRGFFGKLALNVPFTPSGMTDAGVPLAGMGTFRNRKVELTWIGVSSRNGEACALIRYQAFFNRFEMGIGGTRTAGLSHYWGEIWVSLEDKQIEHATLYEQVSLRIGASEETMRPYRVFRIGVLEKAG